MKDYGDPSNVNKVLEIMDKSKPQTPKKESTVGEVEDAVSQNEIDDASINADAISASIEDSAIEPNNTDLETEVQEPISDDDLEAEVKEPLDWTEAIAQHIKEMADVLDEVQRKAKEEAQKLDDLASAPEDPENTLCPGK